MTPAELRKAFRDGSVTTTAGLAPGYVQANLVSVSTVEITRSRATLRAIRNTPSAPASTSCPATNANSWATCSPCTPA